MSTVHCPLSAALFSVQGGGLFLELGKRAQLTGNTTELDEAIRWGQQSGSPLIPARHP